MIVHLLCLCLQSLAASFLTDRYRSAFHRPLHFSRLLRFSHGPYFIPYVDRSHRQLPLRFSSTAPLLPLRFSPADRSASHQPLHFSWLLRSMFNSSHAPFTYIVMFFHRCSGDTVYLLLFSIAPTWAQNTNFSKPNLRLTTSAPSTVQQRCVRQGSLPSNCGPFPPATKICYKERHAFLSSTFPHTRLGFRAVFGVYPIQQI